MIGMGENQLVVGGTQHLTLKWEDYVLHYDVTARTHKETIVFLHPAFADQRVFTDQVRFCSKYFSVITMDLLGHGKSVPGKNGDKIDEAVKHLHAILTVENTGPVHIVGVSMGGMIGQAFAQRYPDLVKSMIMVGSLDINLVSEEVKAAQRKIQLQLLWRAVFSKAAFKRKAAELSAFTTRGRKKFEESCSMFSRKNMKVMSGLDGLTESRPNHTYDFPVHLVVGEYDVDVNLRLMADWHRKIPNGTFRVIHGAGHCVNLDQPAAFNALLHELFTGKRSVLNTAEKELPNYAKA